MISVSNKLLEIALKYGPIKSIYDCGSRDALDGIYLLESLKAEELHVFECNPPSAEKCRNNSENFKGMGRILVNEMAISDVEGELTFFPVDTEQTITPHPDGNPGASSLYRANPDYTAERYVQKEIKVKSTTLDSYVQLHSVPDLLWMDLQGAELKALQGAKRTLAKVKIIHIEIGFRPMFLGQPLFWDIDELLKNQFKLVHISIGRWPKMLWLYKLLGTGPWLGDAIYVNRSLIK